MKKSVFIICCFLLFGCKTESIFIQKMNGVSFVASREEATQECIDAVLNVNATHAAVMPFGFIRDVSSPELFFDTERQWVGETRIGASQYIELLHRNNVNVMVKPQIWISRGVFTGNLKMESEANWIVLENSYRKFILNYAEMAEETHAEVFCIGTELEQFVKHRPEYWTKLINEIKAIYKGKLTYAANWDEYSRTSFWEQIDYIGIDAYFPLSGEKNPSIEQLRAGWQPHKEKIKALSVEKNKPILFTEYGYRSMDYTGKKPWLVDRGENVVNLQAQANATQVILEEFWDEDWFAGGYIWKWFINHEKAGGAEDNRFTPQNKPAEEVIKLYYNR